MIHLLEWGRNYIFWTSAIAWVVAQSLKVVLGYFKEKRFNFKWFIGAGGMPSSHAAGVSALSTSIGVTYGFDSALFAVTAVFTLIVLFDAQGVRRSAGKQARILNKMLDDIYWKKKIDDKQLKELIGHTSLEVIAGMLLGIAVSLLMYR
jgi:uncharacterized protein